MQQRGGIAAAILLSVFITFTEPPQMTGCHFEQVPPTVTKNPDGTYERYSSSQSVVNAVACWTSGQSWTEEWTDYPENGGEKIRVVPADEVLTSE